MPGIKDVARRAGVGVATVSRVINNSGYVSEETKDKIEKAIRSWIICQMNWQEICLETKVV